MRKNTDIIIIGFAIFSMFFGAGNLIFPPYIGMASGNGWLISFLGFIISDVGMILLSINAIAKAGSYQAILGRAGKKFGFWLEFIIMLCLGPILIIPRTGATTLEMSISPLFNSVNPIIFSILFFGLTLILTVKPTKVVDVIGKFLTPMLLIALAILIVKGVVSPLGKLSNAIDLELLFANGLAQGYQTMDALGAGGIAAFIMATFLAKGYKDKGEIVKLTAKASIVAGVGLIIVYGGLTYLGATVSNVYDANISQTTLLISITKQLLGEQGAIILSLVVAFACLTTSIGLTSVTAKYFEDVTNKKIKYKNIVVFICLFSAIISNLGVDRIISIAAPILTVLYPVTLVLVLMASFKKVFTKNSTYKGAAYATLVISIITVIDSLGVNISFIHSLPFASLGLNWVIPAIIGGIVSNLISNFKEKNSMKLLRE
ncbi:branched-chain amino acid transport system II carrier protein [Clostridium botulinum]|nr:branched-chain amino acid transport system II carrier protein [Clostridium botulinum]NFI17501.1 branched-chain amino acid transport system II carrier protein [Clostridium botulinum]NFI52670.1 branched-chain amino acid transport system II carrier protein [Clostridium botulinum]NFL93882.1 branched-chain amino acid transport system II carrier protein [Clostridium botulinum]NFN50498.1 branched-chain amino acid transport system II carrier protein [Clostridium botulinum]